MDEQDTAHTHSSFFHLFLKKQWLTERILNTQLISDLGSTDIYEIVHSRDSNRDSPCRDPGECLIFMPLPEGRTEFIHPFR